MAANPLHDSNAVQEYLVRVGRITARRGRSYYLGGAVSDYQCTTPGQTYTAKVQGEMLYQVTLEFSHKIWSGDCTCPMASGCKHCAAALLGFQARAGQFGPAAAVASSKPKFIVVPRPDSEVGLRPSEGVPAKVRPVKVPPESPFAARLIETLGRQLTSAERQLADKIRRIYAGIRRGQAMTAADLREFCPSLIDWSWSALHLWPETPVDDYEFWLYCAYELRRRGAPVPAAGAKLCDFALIEAKLRAWERQKKVGHWMQTLQTAGVTAAPTTRQKLDCRLAILAEGAQMQCQDGEGEDFKPLIQVQARRLAEQYEHGMLDLTPEAALFWAMLYRPWDTGTWWMLRYGLADAKRLLSRILRQPMLQSRIVTAEGATLARPQERLRLDLKSAQDENDDYVIRLVQDNGATLPRVLATLSGRPPLYLTPTAVFEGPPPHGLGEDTEIPIPAPAVESRAGLQFLSTLGVPLPPRVAERVRHVKLPVRLRINLQPIYEGSPTEEAVIKVEALFDHNRRELLGPSGWFDPDQARTTTTQNVPDHELITIYDRSAQDLFPQLLDALNTKYNHWSQGWSLRVTRKFPEIFASWLKSLPPEIEVLLDKQLETLRSGDVSGLVELEVKQVEMDWFDLQVGLKVTDIELTQEELTLLLNARGGYVRLGAKGWRRLEFDLSKEDDENLARLGLNPRDFTAEPQRLHALQLADDAASQFISAQQMEEIRQRAREIKADVAPAVPPEISAELRPYQVEGFHFLAYLSTNRFGGVLADDMGLGKTLETLTWLAWLRRQPRPAAPANGAKESAAKEPSSPVAAAPPPSLVVCPKSVMDNWRGEAERFLPGLRVRLWRGEPSSALASARNKADLIVINYSQLRSLSPEIAGMPWQAAILDEAQYIKNPDSQTAQVARTLRAEHRLALSGTPIENRLLDLWSIFSYAMPGPLGNRHSFVRRFNQKDDPLARRRLAARVRPFLLRRTKGQVAKDLPDRVEEDILCEMEAEQQTLYRAEYKRARALLLGLRTKQDLDQNRFHFLASLLRLRQICCHPALVNADLIKAESAKVNALTDLLEPLMEEGHKVLVFSQFVTMLDILRNLVEEREWPHYYLAGETENRGDLVKSFQSAEGAAVFLISLKAGGFGLNLMAASYVVLFDPWWNPAVENQAIDRTHRIGQVNKVMAYRLLMKDSIEEKIRVLQRQKAALAQDVLGEERFAQSLTMDDLQFLFSEEP